MEKIILPRSEWPEILKHPKVNGICVNGCVCEDQKETRGFGKKDTSLAHAHVSPHDYYFGWICFKNNKQVKQSICIHELAHLMQKDHAKIKDDNAHNSNFIRALWDVAGSSWYNRWCAFDQSINYLPFALHRTWWLAGLILFLAYSNIVCNIDGIGRVIALICYFGSMYVVAKHLIYNFMNREIKYSDD